MNVPRPDRPPSWARHELEGLLRLGAARDVLDAVMTGQWPADAETIGATARLVEAGELRLRWRDASRAVA